MAASMIVMVTALSPSLSSTHAFSFSQRAKPRSTVTYLFETSPSSWESRGTEQDANTWLGTEDEKPESQPDWQEVMESKEDGTFWATFEPMPDNVNLLQDGKDIDNSNDQSQQDAEEANADAWLDTLASLSAEEVEFNQKENERADMARQMEEWNFSPDVIASTLGVAVDDQLEEVDQAFQDYQNDAYLEEIDMETVESHTTVEIDKTSGKPVRTQMVYVDEHACIGCTNCAMIAQSTFFMEGDAGRARVFQQWGDDDETIQVAIETCPVDCIHYVPFDELKRLEEDRREQNINFKARLVNSNASGATRGNGYTEPQEISGNMGIRCNNCPSRGCKNCPMFGVGESPYFKKKEAERKARMERNRLKREREAQSKRAEL